MRDQALDQRRLARVLPANARPSRHRPRGHGAAFTLLEVMIAMALFFIAVFAILDVTSQALRAARSLDRNVPDIGLIASELLLTNRLEELDLAGQEFGELYPDFHYDLSVYEERTNGLWRADATIRGSVDGKPYEATYSLYVYQGGQSSGRPGLRR